MLFGFALVRLRLRSEPHTPNNVSESLVGTKQIERGIDIQKRPRGFPFSIAAVEGFQRFLLLSQPGIHLRLVELSDDRFSPVPSEFAARCPPGQLGRGAGEPQVTFSTIAP